MPSSAAARASFFYPRHGSGRRGLSMEMKSKPDPFSGCLDPFLPKLRPNQEIRRKDILDLLSACRVGRGFGARPRCRVCWWVRMVVRFVCVISVPVCARVSRVCPGSPRCFCSWYNIRNARRRGARPAAPARDPRPQSKSEGYERARLHSATVGQCVMLF